MADEPGTPHGGRDGLSEDAAKAVAAVVLPGIKVAGHVSVEAGGEHLVVVAAGVGVVRIAKTAHAAALMGRRARLLDALRGAGLPFVVPEPLGEVVTVDGHTALALSWVPGSVHPRGDGDPAVLARVLHALRNVDLAALDGLLDQPHGYAGGDRWAELMARAVDALPADARDDARRRLDDALALPAVPAALVHGDLAGHNMRWNDRHLVGVIDWDWAAGWDPAVDAACLGWHGWAAVAAAVDPTTYRRARIWHRTFGIEQLVASWLRPPGPPDIIARTVEWLRSTRDQP